RILVHLGIDTRSRLRAEAEDEAVRVFAANLRDLLLAAPAGSRATMGLDPGFRTGVKVAVVDATGKVVATDTIYPHVPQQRPDVPLRGAVPIARRVQDPLAERVKIDPKSIGVGQYQHDLAETKLSRSLDAVVEDCVNAVGVDVNTASVPLLTRVSGIGAGLADNIVAHRDANAPFRSRRALKHVPRLGPKAFELSAGFLRIHNGSDPLDASGIHPEAYPVVRRILAATKSQLGRLIGDTRILRQLEPEAFTDALFGVPTVNDILRELEK